MINYYVIDSETSGLNSKYHEVNEISVIRCSDRMQLTLFIKCDYPERANFDSLTITGKTLDDLENGDDKYFAINKINSFLMEDNAEPNGRCIIAHNWSFDMKFIHALYEKCGKEFPAHLWLDTIHLTKEFINTLPDEKIIKTATGRPSTKLEIACKMVGVKTVKGQHNSKSDSRNTYLLWKKLVEEHKIDYIPFIKTAPHIIAKSDEEELIDLLDL